MSGDGTVTAPDGSGRQVKLITADDVIAYLKAHPDFFNEHADPNGDVWITGEKLLRFRPSANAAAPPPFATPIRQVNAGSKIVFGGASVGEGAHRASLPEPLTRFRGVRL